MDLIQESFQRLFPEKQLQYETEMYYTRKLKDFNANIKLTKNKITFNLNLQWKDIDDEIKIGLIQTLFLKIFKQKQHTHNIEIYHNFIKNIPLLTPKTASDPVLERSFNDINQTFFDNKLQKPNLTWGRPSFRKLASYNFHNDKITVSTLFQNTSPEILNYLMYHELLHKHFKFNHKNGRSSFHTKEFRNAEQQYPNHKNIEQQINNISKNQKRNNLKPSKFHWNFF